MSYAAYMVARSNPCFIRGGGVSSSFLLQNIDAILDDHPDVCMIEFGMNDHVAGGLDGVVAYSNTVRVAVQRMKAAGIDVVLVGFFQENDKRDIDGTCRLATAKYNEALREIAHDEGVFFADVYHAFEAISQKKHVVEDMTTDYMHHPTDFGHYVYMCCVLPAFIVDSARVEGYRFADYVA